MTLPCSAHPPLSQTLVAYENLKKAFPFPKPESSITDILPSIGEEDLSRIRARNALKGEFRECRASAFGLCGSKSASLGLVQPFEDLSLMNPSFAICSAPRRADELRRGIGAGQEVRGGRRGT